MSSTGLCRTRLVFRYLVRMCSINHSYEDAVCKLNSLQSNKATLEQIHQDIKTGKKCTNLEDMENYLLRTGISLTTLDKLSVIHIAGTKGKGSTSAMCESILRKHGFRTGFYSSPHLVAVRERIRLDGRVIPEEAFAKHFHRVYDQLYTTQAYQGDMPRYFAFLTVMAYNVFLEEKVDVAIVEVGIGGLLDYTNVIRRVPVVGITALGLDHTAVLGTTLPEIAAAKAGVMKPGCVAYTCPQPAAAMRVLRKVANEVQCTLDVVPDYNTYTFPDGHRAQLQVNLDAYKTNASLAIQLAHAWMRINRIKRVQKKIANGTIKKDLVEDLVTRLDDKGYYDGVVRNVPGETVAGLRECRWPGRYHVIEESYATFYLDGAHTAESMEICAKWFSENNSNKEAVLVFSATGDRQPGALLRPLARVNFTRAYFTVPSARVATGKASDNYTTVEHAELLARCKKNAEVWHQLTGGRCQVSVMGCVAEVVSELQRGDARPAVLVAGSLHLVGHTLSILDPELKT